MSTVLLRTETMVLGWWMDRDKFVYIGIRYTVEFIVSSFSAFGFFFFAHVFSHVQLFMTSWSKSPPDSSVHGIFQARILEQIAIFFLQGIFPTQGSNPCLLH